MSNTVFLLFKLNYDKQQQFKPNDTKTTEQRFEPTKFKEKTWQNKAEYYKIASSVKWSRGGAVW